ncbi:Pc16g09070 [Penicillium rubens Wisconsin 54-1255]|uniref:Pc16g09070 protein n=2 Tax=Penicillium rubens TaxID=1108849 RepID=B6H848_PENRW|nr:Pc16g09070 [Penicillium rubens Wisconsin 54-1255]
MPSKSKEKRPARITIACNACRSRKQKCSGRKPICEQCLDHNRPCNWPKQLRRGPEKGYAEALENRLQLTENILLNLLPHVSDEQLSDAIPRENSGTYMPFPRLEKRGIENWSKFPLDTPQGIRRWHEACTEPERVGAEMQGSKRRRLLSVQMSTSRELDGTSDGTCNGTPNFPVSETADNTHEGNATVERMSSWQGAPSFEFQRQFLWETGDILYGKSAACDNRELVIRPDRDHDYAVVGKDRDEENGVRPYNDWLALRPPVRPFQPLWQLPEPQHLLATTSWCLSVYTIKCNVQSLEIAREPQTSGTDHIHLEEYNVNLRWPRTTKVVAEIFHNSASLKGLEKHSPRKTLFFECVSSSSNAELS